MNYSARDLPFYTKENTASDPTTDETALVELSTDKEPQIRLSVALNPSSSVNVLKMFADEKEKQVISALIRRPELPSQVLERVSYFLFRNIDELLAEGYTDDDLLLDSYICSNAVSHPQATENMLCKASRHPLALLRLGALSNPDLASDVLYDMILKERNRTVMGSVLDHRNSHEAVLKALDHLGVDCEDLPDNYLHQLLLLTLPEMD